MHLAPLTKYLTYHLYHARQLLERVSARGDRENLHQFRVSIRRCRALLRLYLPECYALDAVLRSLVQPTNLLRELDVFTASVDSAAYPKLAKLLERHRREQFAALLDESFLTHAATALGLLYDDLTDLNPAFETEILIDTAERYYGACIAEFEHPDHALSETELHELRIRFKISRYGLEFLHQSGLHVEKAKIRRSKEIQEHLGAIQDAANQLEFLRTFCDAHPLKECRQLLKERRHLLKKLKEATAASRPA